MRLYELFIQEAISLTYLRDPLIKAIKEETIDVTKRMAAKDNLVPQDVKAHAIKDVSMSGVTKSITPEFVRLLSIRLSNRIPDLIKKETGMYSTLRFEQSKVGGSADRTVVNININTLDRLIPLIIENIMQITLDNLGSEKDLFNDFFKSLNTYAGEIFNTYSSRDSDRIIEEMVNTIIHEYVHIAQHTQQFIKGSRDLEYRSYLTKDKSKFYSAINKMHAGETDDESYKLYRASPQEIAAFAHNAALKYIRDIDPDALDSYKRDLNKDLGGYMEDMFSDPTNQQEYKIFKRFHKLMYQEVVRYIEQLEKKQKANAPVR